MSSMNISVIFEARVLTFPEEVFPECMPGSVVQACPGGVEQVPMCAWRVHGRVEDARLYDVYTHRKSVQPQVPPDTQHQVRLWQCILIPLYFK
jgi:hypothetical protein